MWKALVIITQAQIFFKKVHFFPRPSFLTVHFLPTFSLKITSFGINLLKNLPLLGIFSLVSPLLGIFAPFYSTLPKSPIFFPDLRMAKTLPISGPVITALQKCQKIPLSVPSLFSPCHLHDIHVIVQQGLVNCFTRGTMSFELRWRSPAYFRWSCPPGPPLPTCATLVRGGAARQPARLSVLQQCLLRFIQQRLF